MILYSDDTSPYCAPVRAAIYAKGLAIPIEAPPGGFKSEEHRRVTGTGTIPCLMLDDGSPLPESAAILAYLDEKFPERPLRPADPEGRARVILLSRLGEGGLIVPIVQFFHDMTAGAPNAGPKALEGMTLGLERLERFIAPAGYACGPDFTQADCVIAPALFGVKAFSGMMGAPDLMARFPKVAGYGERAAAHPAIAKVLAELQAALAASGTALG
ncbi:MAG: glutathione S-transferase family protein [Caulobacterales bacterium]